MESKPVDPAGNVKESDEDLHYLARLVRTKSKVERLRNSTPESLHITLQSQELPPVPDPVPVVVTPPTEEIESSTATTPSPPNLDQGDSRASTPTPPPVIPRRPLSSCSQHRNSIWDNRTSTLLEVDVLGIHQSNGAEGDRAPPPPPYNTPPQPQLAHDRRNQWNRLSGYFEESMLINDRTGAPSTAEYVSPLVRREASTSSKKGQERPNPTLEVRTNLRQEGAVVVKSESETQLTATPHSAQVPQDPELAHQIARQERMLKRSSQLQLVNYNNINRYKHQSGGKTKKTPGGSMDSVLTSIDNRIAAKKRASSGIEISDSEKSKLAEIFKKKKEQDQMYHHGRDSSNSGSEGELEEIRVRDPVKQDNEEKGWIYRPSGPIPLGFMVGLICTFMLVYNGVLGALVFHASRFPEGTNLTVFLFSIIFIFTAALSLLGYGSSFALARTNSKPKIGVKTGRVPLTFFRVFHILYLCMSFLTFAGMLSWLSLNKGQTGSWDHMLLPQPILESGSSSSHPSLAFESFLKPDPINPNLWVLSPGAWIAAFVAIWMVQLYSWLCLVAFGRKNERTQMLRWRKIQELEKQCNVMQFSY